jgi:oligopeptide transport system permease protein
MTSIAQPAAVSPEVAVLSRPARSLWADAWQRLMRNRAAVIGLIVIVLFAFVALFAPLIAPHNPLQLNSGKDFLPPAFIKHTNTGKVGSTEFLLGTDTLGRDLLSRVIYGARVSMIVGLTPVFIILVIGTIIGLISGYGRPRVDNLLMRATDVVYAFPDLLFYIIMMITLRDTVIGQFMNGLFLLFIALAVVSWVGVARLVRGQVLSLKNKEFIEAARCIGSSDGRIMARHILPNTLSPLVVWMAFTIPRMIIVEAVLGYLGIGIRPTTNPKAVFITSWGQLLLEGQTAINIQPWILLAPAIAVALVVMAFTFVGDGLRDALDPRMRGTM